MRSFVISIDGYRNPSPNRGVDNGLIKCKDQGTRRLFLNCTKSTPRGRLQAADDLCQRKQGGSTRAAPIQTGTNILTFHKWNNPQNTYNIDHSILSYAFVRISPPVQWNQIRQYVAWYATVYTIAITILYINYKMNIFKT